MPRALHDGPHKQVISQVIRVRINFGEWEVVVVVYRHRRGVKILNKKILIF